MAVKEDRRKRAPVRNSNSAANLAAVTGNMNNSIPTTEPTAMDVDGNQYGNGSADSNPKFTPSSVNIR